MARKACYTPEEIGQLCKKIRTDKGLTLQEVAKMFGVTKQYIAQAEKAKGFAYDTIRGKILQTLGGKRIEIRYAVLEAGE
jgi:transcriptional regulator with XRE-family HTH domain